MLDLLSVVPLHSTMFLLIRKKCVAGTALLASLHSTMFLLILQLDANLSELPQNFTFHYVSINTAQQSRVHEPDRPLHSTMFLLIQIKEL